MSHPIQEKGPEKRPQNFDAQRSTGYLLLGFVLSWLPLPVSGLAVLPLLASLFFGIRFQRYMRAHKAPQANQRMGLLGLVMTGVLVLMVGAPLVKYQASMDYQKCMWGANTQQAKASCESTFDQHPNGITQFFME